MYNTLVAHTTSKGIIWDHHPQADENGDYYQWKLQERVSEEKLLNLSRLPKEDVKPGWSEPAVNNAPIEEDEAVQVVLQMNQKPILFPCPGI